MEVERTITISDGNNQVNLNSSMIETVVREMIDFLTDEFISEHYRYYKLVNQFIDEKHKCKIMNVFMNTKDNIDKIKEIVGEEEFKKLLKG